MDADFSIELGPEAPALELPWRDPDGRLAYVDLRSDPGQIERIPEAQRSPALGKFLVEVNLPQSPWQTAKCDVWAEAVERAENLYDAAFAQSCYVDLVLAVQYKALRDGLELHERLARQIGQLMEANEALEATAEIVVRRCYFHCEIAAEESGDGDCNASADTSDAGYCLTLYLSGYGDCAEAAARSWEQALELASGCMLRLYPQ